MQKATTQAAFRDILAVAFDKDGTLVDFHQTWDQAVANAIDETCNTDGDRRRLAEAIGYDYDRRAVRPGSPFIAESAATLDLLVEPFADPRRFEDTVVAQGAKLVVAEPGAAECLSALHHAGVPLALVTNDSEVSARAQLQALGWTGYFAAVLGFDSGYGPKPGSGMIEAAAVQLRVAQSQLAVVGDSSTDIDSARAAGALAVLYGETADQPLVERSDVRISDLDVLVTALRS